jgi:hypothetical protein
MNLEMKDLMKTFFATKFYWKYSKTCLKRNLKGPEHFSTEAMFPFNLGILW